MTEPEQTDERPGLSKTGLLAAFLEVGGALVALATLGWAIHAFWTVSRQDQRQRRLRDRGRVARGRLWRRTAALEPGRDHPQTRHAPRNPGTTGPDHAERDSASPRDDDFPRRGSPAFDQLVTLLREVRDISLLNDEQRTKRLDAQGKEAVRRIEHEAPALLREHSWLEARRLVQEARERFPSFSEWDALEDQIEKDARGRRGP